MYARDFMYDDMFLSDFGFVICKFDNSGGLENVSAGSQLTFNTTAIQNGKKFNLITTQYDECLSTTFQICKNPDKFKGNDFAITDDEFRDIMRWLNRKEFIKFCIIDNNNEVKDYYYEATFNLQRIKINEITYGIELNMITNRPFALHEAVIIRGKNMNGRNQEVLEIYDKSDETGIIYPKVIVNIKSLNDENASTVDLMLRCATVGTSPVRYDIKIKNCKPNEQITIEYPFISTSLSSHKEALFDDFNFVFPKIGNNHSNNLNRIWLFSDIIADISVSYNPIRKVGI